MYALVKDGQVVTYPYNVDQLRRENPNTSFPKNPGFQDLEAFGLFLVYSYPQPDITNAQRVQEKTPIFADGRWIQSWEVVDLTQEEFSNRTDSLALSVRTDRNYKLSQCDWTQAKDISADVSQPWEIYRQQLRDITEQENFPWEVVWPEPPST
jgi:hypothetical protein